MALSLAIDTKEKRNLAILLGLMAALIVGVIVIFVVLPALSGGDEPTPPPLAGQGPGSPMDAAGGPPDAAGGPPGAPAGPNTAAAAGAPGAPPAAAGAPGAAAAPAAPAVPVTAQRVAMPFGRPREDPFVPYYVRIPAPVETFEQRRLQPPPPPVPVPQPSNVFVAPLPVPGGSFGSATQTMIGLSRPPVLTTLPPVQIPQLITAPSMPRLQGGSPQPGVIGRASERRVSGVLIGDSVRAILEIGEGLQKVTRIVQPGDEVDGIKILRIERIKEGGRTITRMIISEAGEERFVELQPSTERTVETGQPGGGITFTAPPAAGPFGGAPAAGGNPFGLPRN